mmetsp:Transcript_13506/g.37365  ORF Transcript_13506/g.37365 Transcript_13506/m.37365 type:complete len:265 (-) Transcript_13506:889-1683(-)
MAGDETNFKEKELIRESFPLPLRLDSELRELGLEEVDSHKTGNGTARCEEDGRKSDANGLDDNSECACNSAEQADDESAHADDAIEGLDEDEERSSSRGVSLQNLTDEEFEAEIMDHLADFDTDDPGSGCIASEHLGALLDALADDGVIIPVDEDELEMMKNDMDADGNGLIASEELVDCLLRRRRGEDFTDDELKEAFEVFDHLNRGFITPLELRQAMKAIFDIDVPALDARSMIMAASKESGSQINLEEFKAIIRWRKNAML